MESIGKEKGTKKLSALSTISSFLSFVLNVLFFLGFFFPFLSVSYARMGMDQDGNQVIISYKERRTLITVFQDDDFTFFGYVFAALLFISLVLSVFSFLSLIRNRRYTALTYPLSALLFSLSGFLFTNASVLSVLILCADLAYYAVYNADFFKHSDTDRTLPVIGLFLSIILFVVCLFLGVSLTPMR